MAKNSNQTPPQEYNKISATVVLVFADGSELPLADRWEEATFNPNGQTGTLAGSGKFRRAHVPTRYEPTFAITVDLDLATEIEKRRNDGVIKQVKITRQRNSTTAPVTDLLNHWNPPIGEQAYGDDASTCELSGELLSFELDATNKIVVSNP